VAFNPPPQEVSIFYKVEMNYSNKHSVFLLFYHLILVVKYRKRVIDGRVSARLKEMFIEIGGHKCKGTPAIKPCQVHLRQ
jgi:REP element-mobilizing transposase RayT